MSWYFHIRRGVLNAIFSSLLQLYIKFYFLICTIVHKSPSLPHVQISCYLLAIGFWTPCSTAHLSFKLYFTAQYVGLHKSPSQPHVQVTCSLLVIGFWTPCSTAHIRFILYFTVQLYTSHIYYRTFSSPDTYSHGYWLVYYCPNQLLLVHCTVRFTHESPLLPHVHISNYLGLMYWLLVWVILCSAAHSALHYNYFIVQFAHESPSLPHVQVSLYLLMDIGFCNSLFSSALQLCTIWYTTIITLILYVLVAFNTPRSGLLILTLLAIGLCTEAHFSYTLYSTVRFVHELLAVSHIQVSCYLMYWLFACVQRHTSFIHYNYWTDRTLNGLDWCLKLSKYI